ncbi:MAG: hypothetical protein MUC88_26450, partial [Planctomycetes bacterium]|nr:hypothetical protein [Planctomycetota bacterium]
MMDQCGGGYRGEGGMPRRLGFLTRSRSLWLASVCLLVVWVVVGCTSTGSFPQTSGTQVDLSKKNFR